jgi:hypothetical protein
LPRLVCGTLVGRSPLSALARAAGEVDEWEAELPFTVEQQARFLSHYWQKRPLLVRGAAPSVVVSGPHLPNTLRAHVNARCSCGGSVGVIIISWKTCARDSR